VKDWSQPIPQQEAHHRAGGRRQINAQRQQEAGDRYGKFLALLDQRGFSYHLDLPRGMKTSLAQELGLSGATISRYWRQHRSSLDDFFVNLNSQADNLLSRIEYEDLDFDVGLPVGPEGNFSTTR
jgi:hypothetical protein